VSTLRILSPSVALTLYRGRSFRLRSLGNISQPHGSLPSCLVSVGHNWCHAPPVKPLNFRDVLLLRAGDDQLAEQAFIACGWRRWLCLCRLGISRQRHQNSDQNSQTIPTIPTIHTKSPPQPQAWWSNCIEALLAAALCPRRRWIYLGYGGPQSR